MAVPRPLFAATTAALGRVTELFDFLWPAAVGLWNLRWQVQGLDRHLVRASEGVLQARFVAGSEIHGANLRRACIDTAWSQQLEQLGHVALANIFAVYEAWSAEVVEEATARASRELAEGLQFPSTSAHRRGKRKHVQSALASLRSGKSSAMSAYEPAFLASSVAAPNNLDDLLNVYRCFKECRNSIMHNGGRASQAAVDALSAAAAVAAQPTPPFRIPPLPVVALGQPVQITLFSVVGFSDLVRRLVVTIDGLLVGSQHGERALSRRWRATLGVRTLKTEPKARVGQLQRLLGKLHLPPTSDPAGLEALLLREGLVN